MPTGQPIRVLGLVTVLLLAVTAFPGVLAQRDGDEGRALPAPREESSVFGVNATAGGGGTVVLTWTPQEGAAGYEVWVNNDTEDRPTWVRAENGSLEADEEADVVTFVDEDPPEPANGRESISYAVLALDENGDAVAQGRAAAEPNGLEWPPRLPSDQTEEEATPATMTGTLVGLLALVVIAIGALAFIGFKRRGH